MAHGNANRSMSFGIRHEMGGNLVELSKDLAMLTEQQCPEEYIRKTLRAHGFFTHSEDSKSVQSDEKTTSKTAKQGCGISQEDKKRTTQLICHYKEGKEFHTLKEPRSLFTHARNSKSLKNLPLWPSEVECIALRPKFITMPPPYPEPFYRPDREVISPKIRSMDGGGTVVYTNTSGPEKYFIRSRAGPSLNVKTTPTRTVDDTTLTFESRFESGNLAKAVQVGRWDYELYLRYDLYTNKHTQWFYFSVRNMREGQKYRFTIVNLYKAGSLYNEGMQPVVHSEMEATAKGIGWQRGGHAIKYFKTPIRRVDTKQEVHYYGLTWSYTFKHGNDTCYFAHCYPYTYSDMQDYLQGIMADQEKAKYCKQRTLCHTIAGNPVPLLTITSPLLTPEETKEKRAVVVTSRVHPGETNGSWMMKGLVDFLTGPSPDAKILRDSFVFKLVPMLNPDGVIVGNYRCSLAGRDLNRNYRTKLKESYPTVWHSKIMVKRLVEEREVVVYCDLHGHSRKQNVFIYGCDNMADPYTRLHARVFPKILAKNAPGKFSFKGSKFTVHKSKEGTGRVVMWREMGIKNSYTMEATFCGSVIGRKSGYQFTTADLEEMGYHFCDTLLDYCDPDQTKVEHILRQLEEEYRQFILAKLAALGQEVPLGVDLLDIILDSELESSDAGSDSSESDGPPVHLMGREKKKKRKKLKSRKERNKHKVLLKLTHHKPQTNPPPTTQPPPAPSLVETMKDLPSGGRRPSIESSFHYSHLEAARNGGIPIFIQERILERQKRRGEVDSTERLSDEDYLESFAMEYMKQDLPQPPLQEPSTRGSTFLLPRPPCPMNISPAPVCESRPKPPSRVSSRTSLPQLAAADPLLAGTTSNTNTMDDTAHNVLLTSGSHAVFASHYVATHLKDVIASPSSSHLVSGMAAANSTRNLANLSKLFRQLRPHLLHGQSTRSMWRSCPEGREKESPSGVELHSMERKRAVEFSEQTSTRNELQYEQTSREASDRHTESNDNERTEKSQSFSYGSPPDVNHVISGHDKKVLTDMHSSYNTSLRSMQLTEGFSKPAEMSERMKELERISSSVEMKQPAMAAIDARLPENLHRAVPTHHDSLLRSLAGGRRKEPGAMPNSQAGPIPTSQAGPIPKSQAGPIPKSHSAPDPSIQQPKADTGPIDHVSPLTTDNVRILHRTSIRTHKKRVAAAVESVHNAKKLFREPASDGREEERDHSIAVQTHWQPEQPSAGAENGVIMTSISQSQSTRLRPATTSETLRPADHWQTTAMDYSTPTTYTESVQYSTSDRYIPIAASRMFSSKPPSRYGPRPTAEHGTLPSTVSLMLSGRVKSRPSTMYNSRRPLHIKYFTSRKNSYLPP